MRRSSILCAVLLAAVASPAVGQRSAAIGETVKIQVSGAGRAVTGVVKTWSATEVHLEGGSAGAVQVPVGSILSVRVRDGRRPGRGALTGGVVGGLTGALVGVAAMAGDGGFIDFGPEVIAPAALFMGGAGALIGLVVGSFVPNWVPASLPGAGGDESFAPKNGLSLTVGPGAASTWRIGVRLR